MNKNKKTENSQSQNQLKGLIRLLGYMFKHYKIQTLFVIVFICLSSFGMVIGTMYSKQLIDGIIIPNIGKNNPNFINELVSLILKMAVVYGGAVICTYIYEIFMIYVAQGTLKRLRDDVFIHMESLPIKYFDTNAHGDIMSVYSSDIDALRNMMVESLSQVISSIIYKCPYFNVYIKYSTSTFRSSNDYNYDYHNKNYFFKKFKKLYCTAKKYWYCKWICGRNDRRTESCKSIFVREKG